MFKVKIPSFETYKIGTRPAVLTSLRQTLEYFDIDMNQLIFFNGEAEVSKLIGGEYNDKRGGDLKTDVGYDNKIFVELETDMGDYNNELDNYSGDDSIPPMWFDPMTGSKMTPKFSTRIYRVTVNKFMKDRVTAQRYYESIRSKVLGPQLNSTFNVDTHYPITYPVMQCYKEIFDRLIVAKQLPADKDFIDWMFECSTTPPAILRNLIGNNPVFVFKQSVEEVGVNIENPNLATVVSGPYIGKFEVSFQYWFYWSEHKEWILEYPMQVWQQPMPVEYIPEVFDQNIQPYPLNGFMEYMAGQRIWGAPTEQAPFYHILPRVDNWRPPPTYWISPQLQVVTNVEDIEEQVLINIKEIQGFEWNKVVLDYIIKYRDKVTSRHRSPMQFKVYSDGTEVLNEQIVLRENGDLILTRKPTMSAIYRITFNFDYALRLYSEDCIEDMLEDPEYARWIIGILFPQYDLNPDFGTGGVDDWWEVHNDIEVGDGDQVDFFLPYGTLSFTIVAHNEDNYAKFREAKDRGFIDGTDYYRDPTGKTP